MGNREAHFRRVRRCVSPVHFQIFRKSASDDNFRFADYSPKKVHVVLRGCGKAGLVLVNN
jgi:hypothetical protein